MILGTRMDVKRSRTGLKQTRSVRALSGHRLWLICASVLMAWGCAMMFLAAVSHTARAYNVSFYVERRALQCTRSARLTLGDIYARQANRLRTDASFWISYATEDAARHALAITPECSRSLGAGFVRQAAETAGNACHSAAESSSSSSSSRLECFVYPVRQAGLGCAVSNLVIDGSRFMGDGPPIGAPQHEAYTPKGSAASIRLTCAINPSTEAVSSNLQHDRLPWWKGAYAQATAEELSGICNDRHSTAYKTPAMFVTRLDPTNPYHHTQSVVQAFLSLAALDSTNRTSDREQGLQVILADHFIDGPFLDIWERISYPHPVLRLKNLTRSGEYICFKQAVLAHYTDPAHAFLGYEGVGTEHACPSTILMAVSHWLRYVFLATSPAPHTMISFPSAAAAIAAAARHVLELPRGHQRLNVVFVSRSWFERSMSAGGGLTSWQQKRTMQAAAEVAVVHALQDAVHKWNQQACVPPVFGWWQRPRAVAVQQQQGCKPTNVSFDLQVADFSVLELYPSQFHMLSKSAVLVAAHGAALANMIFMRPHMGAIVEVFYGQYHYVNQAHMLGHKHFKTGHTPEAISAAVASAMDHVSNAYQQQMKAPVKP